MPAMSPPSRRRGPVRVATQVRLSPAAFEFVVAIAEQEDSSLSQVIRDIVEADMAEALEKGELAPAAHRRIAALLGDDVDDETSGVGPQ